MHILSIGGGLLTHFQLRKLEATVKGHLSVYLHEVAKKDLHAAAPSSIERHPNNDSQLK